MLDFKTMSKFENLLGRITERCTPREISALFDLTEKLICDNRPQDAIACLKLAVFYHPEADVLWAKLGDLYISTGSQEKAFEAYNQYRRIMAERLVAGDESCPLPPPATLTGILSSGAVH